MTHQQRYRHVMSLDIMVVLRHHVIKRSDDHRLSHLPHGDSKGGQPVDAPLYVGEWVAWRCLSDGLAAEMVEDWRGYDAVGEVERTFVQHAQIHQLETKWRQRVMTWRDDTERRHKVKILQKHT